MARSDWHRPQVDPVDENTRRIKLTISYDGTAFHGWQSQDNGISVQQVLEGALKEITGLDVTIQGSGRTDRGVHALGQVAHFDVPKSVTIPQEKFAIAMNCKLPQSVRVLSSEEMEGVFHARFTAMAREYKYFVKEKSDMLPFDVNRITGIHHLPPLELLNSYATFIKGTHDFTTFCSARDDCTSKYRDIYESYWSETRDIYNRRIFIYTVCGNAFLYHQVRSMVGTMLTLGQARSDSDIFREILESKERSRALQTAPSDGLYLSRISYDEEEYRWFEEESGDKQ
ncbi:MAG: tRNA pseudouridine(38-40) synthase TruA [Sphaerochaetaceae bacterium]|nr:tRNA pseudouridine(38-40) synthase TruA [Sphaerochaetaceae bacterium]